MNCLMQSESKFLPDFSHIYIESKAQGFNLTKKCIRNFPKAKIIEISDYKSIFNRPRQDFQTQKQSMKLILAIKKPPYIYIRVQIYFRMVVIKTSITIRQC